MGRRWNIDPISYPWQSQYSAFNDNPIYYADPSGLEGGGDGAGDGTRSQRTQDRDDPMRPYKRTTTPEKTPSAYSPNRNITVSFFDSKAIGVDEALTQAYNQQVENAKNQSNVSSEPILTVLN